MNFLQIEHKICIYDSRVSKTLFGPQLRMTETLFPGLHYCFQNLLLNRHQCFHNLSLHSVSRICHWGGGSVSRICQSTGVRMILYSDWMSSVALPMGGLVNWVKLMETDQQTDKSRYKSSFRNLKRLEFLWKDWRKWESRLAMASLS